MIINGRWIKGSVKFCPRNISRPYRALAEYEKQYQKYFSTRSEAVEYLKNLYEEHGCPPPRVCRASKCQQSNTPFGQGQSQLSVLLGALMPKGK